MSPKLTKVDDIVTFMRCMIATLCKTYDEYEKKKNYISPDDYERDFFMCFGMPNENKVFGRMCWNDIKEDLGIMKPMGIETAIRIWERMFSPEISSYLFQFVDKCGTHGSQRVEEQIERFDLANVHM